MQNYNFLISLIFFASIQLGQAQEDIQVFSLEQATSYASEHSSNIKSAQLDIAYSKAQVQEYTAIGIPKVNAELSYNYYPNIPTQIIPDFISPAVYGVLEGTGLIPPGSTPEETGYVEAKFGTNNNLTASITASTLVFDGSYFVGLKAAKGLKKMTERQADLSSYELEYTVKSAYQMALIAEENRYILQKNIESLQGMLRESQIFYKNGLIEQLDVDRLELSVANLETEMAIVDRQTQLALNALKFQMGYPMNKEIELADSLDGMLAEANLEDLTGDLSYNQRIELDILQQTEHLNELNMRRIHSGYLPSLSAFATHQQVLQRNNLFDNDEPGFTPTTVLGLSLNIPIFDGMDKTAKYEMARINKERYSLQIRDFKRSMNLQVVNARANYTNANQRLESQKNSMALAEKILKTTKLKYKEGVGSSLEMMQAEQELYRTQGNYLNAKYDLIVAKTNLDKALGK